MGKKERGRGREGGREGADKEMPINKPFGNTGGDLTLTGRKRAEVGGGERKLVRQSRQNKSVNGNNQYRLFLSGNNMRRSKRPYK